VIANGFSCREQISQETDRHALHLAEILQMALREGPGGTPGYYPEAGRVRQQEAEMQKSMRNAAVTVAGLTAAGALLWRLSRSR
jgi:hypothetical protein